MGREPLLLHGVEDDPPAWTCGVTFKAPLVGVVVGGGGDLACPPRLVLPALGDLLPWRMHPSCHLPRQRSKKCMAGLVARNTTTSRRSARGSAGASPFRTYPYYHSDMITVGRPLLSPAGSENPRYLHTSPSVRLPHRPVCRNSIHLQRADNPCLR